MRRFARRAALRARAGRGAGRGRARTTADRLAGGSVGGTVAFAGPLPPTPSGIATYDRAVLDGLRRIGFTDRTPVEALWPVGHHHHATIGSYRLGVYQLGNNVEHHLDVYRLAWAAPGLVVLHDLALDDFVRGLQSAGDMLGLVAMREALGAHRALETSGFEVDGPLRVPWSSAIARHARGVIVHAPFARRYLEAYGCRTPIFVVPHPPIEAPVALRAAAAAGRQLRASVASRGARSLVVAAGDMNEAKQLGAVAAAVAALGPDVHLAVVGRRVHTHDVDAELRPAALGDRVRVHADVSDGEFLGWLAAADVVVDLRYPHRGEVSGTLTRAMQVGGATIVSGTGAYLDEPAGTVATIPSGPADPADLAACLRDLLADDARRRAIGEAARVQMEALRATDATAHGYAEAIEATARLVHDPLSAPMQRWARSLVEIGVSREQLSRGWGRKYADALESFKRTS
jgi:glycosyltransferase involved in cell wall biosynthesis